MTYETVMAGFGGQGLLFSGKVLAYAGLLEGRELGRVPLLAGRSVDRSLWAYVARTVKETIETGV